MQTGLKVTKDNAKLTNKNMPDFRRNSYCVLLFNPSETARLLCCHVLQANHRILTLFVLCSARRGSRKGESQLAQVTAKAGSLAGCEDARLGGARDKHSGVGAGAGVEACLSTQLLRFTDKVRSNVALCKGCTGTPNTP
ncbi:hypothetical protein PoB_002680200 [Plakobranchus ocellatus]|uniref:Uncharacterized protein n=1 Tax=Plakobranchus ocellatus TaxID=259542 RepID=A0AAV4A0B9_9GAST|nr:hypothetical protein PoB_002680200 [Plakobranchus ocellatus]